MIDICTDCDGFGEVWEPCNCYQCEYSDAHSGYVPCDTCAGTGTIYGDLYDPRDAYVDGIKISWARVEQRIAAEEAQEPTTAPQNDSNTNFDQSPRPGLRGR